MHPSGADLSFLGFIKEFDAFKESLWFLNQKTVLFGMWADEKSNRHLRDLSLIFLLLDAEQPGGYSRRPV